MARPLRIEFPGAIYHVTSRGDRREDIFADDTDRLGLLGVVGHALDRLDAQMLAYCLMGNHYHLVIHTRQANLSQIMRHINGVYTQSYNRRHQKVGHLFQGRFKAILVDRDAYLLEVCRYVELNPVRAKMVESAQRWPWSSFRAHAGLLPAADVPAWLDVVGLHGYMLGRDPKTTADHALAASRYAQHVNSAPDVRLWDDALRQQIYLGDEGFVERMQARMNPVNRAGMGGGTAEVPKAQKRPARSLAQWLNEGQSRNEAVYLAYTQGRYTMGEIAQQLALSVSRVSRLVARFEQDKVSVQAKGKT